MTGSPLVNKPRQPLISQEKQKLCTDRAQLKVIGVAPAAMPDFDVIVVGGGIVGTAFALALRSAHVSVALIEEGTPVVVDSSWDSRIYTISPGNADWLAALGVWDAIPA